MTTNTIDLFQGLKELNADVHLLVGKAVIPACDVRPIYNRLDGDDRVVYCCDKGSVWGRIQTVVSIAWHILRLSPDIIHCESPYFTFIPWLLRRKFVSTMHVTNILPIKAYKHGQHLIAISRETRDYAVSVLGHKQEAITVVLHGVSDRFLERVRIDMLNDLKQNYGIGTDKIVIGFVGTIEYRKGIDVLLDAIASLPEEVKSRIHLLIVGNERYNAMTEIVKPRLNKYHLHSLISFVGFTDPQPFYQLMDIFVLPSRLEGFGLAVPEAMLSGCCVVRSNTEGSTEQIEDGIDGFIFSSEDVSSLSCILVNLVSNSHLRTHVAEQGRKKAITMFSSRRMAEQTLDVYYKVLSQSSVSI